MMATGEPQTRAPQLDSLELARLLRRRLAGEASPHSFIHEADAYSAAPADLVRGREHAPGTGQAGDGKGMAWYFCSTANCHESAGGAPRRNRQVGGGSGERRFWHPEGGKEPILGPDRKPVEAYWRTLSYVLKIKNPPGAKKSFRNKRLGWCMVEIGLQQQDGDAGHQHQLVLCKVYRSPRSTADPAKTSTAAAGAEDVGPAAGGISGVEDWLQHDSAQEGGAIPEEPLDVYRSPRADAEASVPSGGMPCPTPFECGNQSMELAMEDGRPVIVKNSYIPQTPGTVITKTRDMSKSILTSIELKRNVTILDIERTSTLDQDAFVLVMKAISIFQNFEDLGISVDWVATSEGKMSFTLVPSQLLSQEVIQPALDKAVQNLQKFATVDRLQDRSVISLIGNPQMSIVILGKALDVLGSNTFTVEKVPRGSPKVANVSLVVHDSAAERCVQLLSAFFELNGCPVPVPIPVSSSGAASSSDKRKADDGHPEAPAGVRQELTDTRSLLPDNDGDLTELFDSAFGRSEMARVDGGYNNYLMPGGMDDIFFEESAPVVFHSGPNVPGLWPFEEMEGSLLSDNDGDLTELPVSGFGHSEMGIGLSGKTRLSFRKGRSLDGEYNNNLMPGGMDDDSGMEHLIFHAGKESSTLAEESGSERGSTTVEYQSGPSMFNQRRSRNSLRRRRAAVLRERWSAVIRKARRTTTARVWVGSGHVAWRSSSGACQVLDTATAFAPGLQLVFLALV